MTLNEYVDACLRGTAFEDDTTVSQIIRQVNPTLNLSYTLIIADEEPHNRVLPLNVVWLCMDKTKPHYRKLMKRESKEASELYTHTWQQLETINQVWANQYYDPADLEGGDVNHATTTKHGTARLTTAAEFDSAPRFVSTSDPRNTDARTPLYHEHAEKPAVELQHEDSQTLNIDKEVPADLADGSSLVGVNRVEVAHQHVKLSDITAE